MSSRSNDSISLDDLIAAVSGSSSSDSGRSSSGSRTSSSEAAGVVDESAPSIDLLSALGLESLPSENSKPVFYSEREERERKREAQRREQQIRSQQWQRELREIEARKARIEAEKPVPKPELDENVVQTLPPREAQTQIEGAREGAEVARQTSVPKFEKAPEVQQPIPEPKFMADHTKEVKEADVDTGAGAIRHTSFSSLPQTSVSIAPLQVTAKHEVATPESAQAASTTPKKISFSDYRAGQVSITPLGATVEDGHTAESSDEDDAQTASKVARPLPRLITQDHSQAFIQPLEAMNTPVATPEPDTEADDEQDFEVEAIPEDVDGFYEEHEELVEAENADAIASDIITEADFEDAFTDEDDEAIDVSDEGDGEGKTEAPQITKRSFPVTATSSFTAIEPELKMHGEEDTGEISADLTSNESADEVYYPADPSLISDESQQFTNVEYQIVPPTPTFTESAPQFRQPDFSSSEDLKDPKSKSRIVGIILIVVALLCAVVAIVIVSGMINFGSLMGTSVENEASNESVSTIVYEPEEGADSATYSYVVRGPDGSTHEATESAVFDEDGILIESTITVDVENQESADRLLEQLREEFGSSVMDYKATDSEVIIVLDIERDDLTKEIYTELLSANMAEFKVVGQ